MFVLLCPHGSQIWLPVTQISCLSWPLFFFFPSCPPDFVSDLRDFDSLDESSLEENTYLSFDVAEREFGISPLMTVEEMSSVGEPDSLSMVMYLSQFYQLLRDKPPPASETLKTFYDTTLDCLTHKPLSWYVSGCFSLSESEFWPEISAHHSSLPPQQTGTQSVQEEKPKGPAAPGSFMIASLQFIMCLYDCVFMMCLASLSFYSSPSEQEQKEARGKRRRTSRELWQVGDQSSRKSFHSLVSCFLFKSTSCFQNSGSDSQVCDEAFVGGSSHSRVRLMANQLQAKLDENSASCRTPPTSAAAALRRQVRSDIPPHSEGFRRIQSQITWDVFMTVFHWTVAVEPDCCSACKQIEHQSNLRVSPRAMSPVHCSDWSEVYPVI